MTEQELRLVVDGGPLHLLPSGLVIIRRMKHEWRDDLRELEFEKLKVRTGKVWGSKFLTDWTLTRTTDWIVEQIETAGWKRQTTPFPPLNVLLPDPVGLVAGQKVHTIRIVCDGHYVHAYPVKD